MKRKWDRDRYGSISENSIRESLEHSGRYRISTRRYPRGTTTSGQTKCVLVYVLSGKCKYAYEGGEVVLGASEYGELPPGKYTLVVLGDGDYEEVRVWPLPEAFWQ